MHAHCATLRYLGSLQSLLPYVMPVTALLQCLLLFTLYCVTKLYCITANNAS